MQINKKRVNAKRIHAELDYVKLILAKVSFDQALFKKELKKAIGILLPHEISYLKEWCYQRFGRMYASVLNECFLTPYAG